MPLVPPCMRNHSPGFRPPRSKTLCQTVKKPSGMAAASIIETPAGTGRHAALVGEAILRVAAAIDQRHDRVARLEAVRFRAGGGDGAGDFEPGNLGMAFRRRIEAQPLHHIGTIDAGGSYLDQHLPAARLRHRHGRRLQHVGAAFADNGDGGHGGGKCGHRASSIWPRSP